jgi:protease-4
MRFVIDTVPAQDDYTETTVMEDKSASSKIALIDVRGMLIDADRSGMFARGENPVAGYVEALHRAEDDSKVRAIIVRLNSPGGTVTASDVMYRETLNFKERSKKPVVMLMSDLAASGAMYLACAGDEIIAHPTTITGSIGVIMQTMNFSEGMSKIGIKADAITSGPNKAMGSPFQPMPAEHRELFQGLVNEFYTGFRGIVVEHRPALAESDIQWITDGRVVTGARAAEIGLVDSTGDIYSAFASAKRRAGIASAKLVKYHRPLDHVGSAYAAAPIGGGGFGGGGSTTQFNMLQLNLSPLPNDSPGFYYLWDPMAW